MPLLWQASVFDRSGYSEETRCLVYACASQARTLALRDWPTFDKAGAAELDRRREELLRLALAVPEPAPPYVEVIHKTILPASRARLYPETGPTVVRTMFETDGLPLGWASHLNRFDGVWVPSHFNVQTFAKAGVSPEKLRILPETVDLQTLAAARGAEPFPVPQATRRWKFLSVFEFSERKGWRILLDAWSDAFGCADDVVLILKCSTLVHGAHAVAAVVREYLSGRNAAPVVVLEDTLSSHDLARLYCVCDAFVLASRGEGWGRPLMEAMALGLPTIGPAWGGNRAFMSEENAFLIPGELVRVEPGPLVFERYVGQRWFAPDQGELARAMRLVVEDRTIAIQHAERAAADVRRQFGAEVLVDTLADLVDSALGGGERRSTDAAPDRADNSATA